MHQITPVYWPHSNGMVERKITSSLNMVIAVLTRSGLPNNLWQESFFTNARCIIEPLCKDSKKHPTKIGKIEIQA